MCTNSQYATLGARGYYFLLVCVSDKYLEPGYTVGASKFMQSQQHLRVHQKHII